MPFAVFRRHQRTLLAALALLAMVAFTLDLSLFRNRGMSAGNDQVVVVLYKRPVHRSDLQRMALQRSRANKFMGRLFMTGLTAAPITFGATSTRALVDALILEHEANAQGMPASPEVAKQWLRTITNDRLTSDQFDLIYQQGFSDEVTDDGLLAEIANQIRLLNVFSLPGRPQVTPLDVYQAYRDQYERVSAVAVPMAVADFVKQVPEPSDSEVTAYYEKYKDVLPDSTRDTPGFMIPQRVRLEVLTLDAAALTREARSKLTEEELRKAYEARKADLPVPPPQLPIDLFAGDPKATLTPHDAFYDVRPYLENQLAEQKAAEQVDEKFGAIKDKVMYPFSEQFAKTAEDNKEAKTQSPLPDEGDRLKDAAAREKVAYERTPLLTREEAAHYPFLATAREGSSTAREGRPFVDKVFDTKMPLFDPFELSDMLGHRFMAWKVEDLAARVPGLAECRPQVVLAWKTEKARPLAEAAAKALAEAARKKDGDLRLVAGSRTVIVTQPISKLVPNPGFGQFQFESPRQSQIAELPNAGEALREAYFNLAPKSVAVAADQPGDTYYVLALKQRIPADFTRLYDTFGPYFSVRAEVEKEATDHRVASWMDQLRAQAGLKPDWKPAEETRGGSAQPVESDTEAE